MFKRKTALTLILAMLLTLLMPSFAFGADYSGHWAENTIQKWFDGNKLKGYEDGSFRPDSQITRAEFMTMVNNAFEYTEKETINFRDVNSNDWYYPEVQKAVKAGYLMGYEDNTARPDNKISRQEAALIIARIKELSDYASGVNVFNDSSQIATWAKGGVGAIARAKYMIGYEDNTFRPVRFISRAEALVIIDRSYEEETPTEPTEPTTPPNGGSGGGGGGGGGGTVTTAAAIITSFKIEDENGLTFDVTTPSAVTTGSVLFTTTSSAITITAITTPNNAIIDVKITPQLSPSSVTTLSAVNGVISIDLDENDEYLIELTVSSPQIGNTVYTDTTYKFIVKKE
ncbi:S-layer homology domain-containing protein [Sedimentibacter sp.]|uniref:S-layer homology domain-containing protein n=1 Tax=Sedimentibacter sp. TaxID=1960295 RepID=UPI0028A7125A|nr:S-layer homology domain-containing protein [Sedimentibacter sp.]